jgi:hypothetical protein
LPAVAVLTGISEAPKTTCPAAVAVGGLLISVSSSVAAIETADVSTPPCAEPPLS